jgi:hypothetical protein
MIFMNRKLKIVIGLIVVMILSLISALSCRNIYGELSYVEDGSGKEGIDDKGFPNYYLTEEQQQTPYIQGPTIVFDSRGGNNTQIYHIPAIIVADNGNIIAFGDNRHQKSIDIGFTKGGLIDIVYKISKDGGQTWSAEKIIKPISTSDDVRYTKNKGDVSVFKALDGRLVALAVSGGGFANGHNPGSPSRMLRSKSYDNGETWTPWEEVGQNTVFSAMKNKGIIRGFATSGRGTTLKDGTLATAMVGSSGGGNSGWVAYFLYSKDKGDTWHIYSDMNTATSPNGWLITEPKIVGELDDGKLLMSVRNGSSSKFTSGKPRMYGVSSDKGKTWGDFNNPKSGILGYWNNMLCGNVDSEGIIWTRESEHDKTRILHLLTGPMFRGGMSFWVSLNGGKNFTKKLDVLKENINPSKYTAGYNSIDVLGDGTVIALSEEYNESNTKLGTADYDLVFRRYNMKAITGEVYKTEWYKSVTNKYITE